MVDTWAQQFLSAFVAGYHLVEYRTSASVAKAILDDLIEANKAYRPESH
ncbi:maltose-6'-phosphate glucosidase [Shigella flexneri]